MNHNADRDDLPELSDEDVALLHQIATLATTSPEAPFKALFAAYDIVTAEQGVKQEHDGVLFRLLLRVGEATGKRGRRGGVVDLVGSLRELLAAQGITIVEGDEGENEDQDEVGEETRSVNVGYSGTANGAVRPAGRRKKDPGRRRVSFNDARMDETWLSGHSRSLVESPPQQPGLRGLLSQPARRGRFPDASNTRRARSSSSQRTRAANYPMVQQPASTYFHEASQSTLYTSEPEDININPTLLFQPSQTQLEQNAEAFASTSAIRSGRQCLHIWHDRALILRQARQQAYAIAAAHDGHTLLKQAFDQWRTNLVIRRETRQEQEYWESKEKDAGLVSNERVLRRALSHWYWASRDQREATQKGKRLLLARRFFAQWRKITEVNIDRARSVLLKKYWAAWLAKLARKRNRDEQVDARYEEWIERKYLLKLRCHLSLKAARLLRESNLKIWAFNAWVDQVRQRRLLDAQAEAHCRTHVARQTIIRLRQRLAEDRAHNEQAYAHHDRHLAATCLHTISVEAKLMPIAHTLALKVRLNLQRNAFGIWYHDLQILRQAADVNRQRVLQAAWTTWNDRLRCQALGQRIDERVLVETLYKWVLAERMTLFRRNSNARLLRDVLGAWRGKVVELHGRTAEAEAAFTDVQERRSLAYGMRQLHAAMRRREDAERAATKFANAHALPNVLQILAAKTRHALELETWAVDARFYTLCTRSLAVWRERTTQHVHNRRRDAYARVRARVKGRIVGSCLSVWHAKTAHLRALHEEAEQKAQVRLFHVGTKEFDRWRTRSVQMQELQEQATVIDRQRLLASALQALSAQSAHLQTLDSQAETFKHETQLAALAAALKKLQWATFTASRRSESADALWARNRDQHIRAMLRHWFSQASTHREAKRQAAEEVEPDSPSLRPASRAASRSAQRPPPTSPSGAATPAYMRTPSRSRRAGRFRALPTPAPMTPFVFDQAYLATTPAPLQDEADGIGTLTPQVTPFARKLRAGGFVGATPAPVLRRSVFERSGLGIGGGLGGTAKSVRFAAGGRFGGGGSS